MTMLNQNKPVDKFKIKGVDEIFGSDFENTPDEEINNSEPMEVEIELLQEFRNHPFKVQDDDNMAELVNSIKENGIINPILVRKISTGGLEIIAGHRRTHAAKLAGLNKVPVVIRDLTDEDAAILMVDSNIQREEILPSEKAYAYRIKMDAMNRKGQKNDIKVNTAKEIGEKTGDSERQVNRYIKLSYLIPEIMNLVDQKKISTFTIGLPLAYLTEAEQIYLYTLYAEKALLPNAAQAEILKKLSAEKKLNGEELTPEEIEGIFVKKEEKKKNKIQLNTKKVKEFFPEDTSVEDMEKVIYRLLTDWKNSKEN